MKGLAPRSLAPIAIVGPTAVGKSRCAMHIAERIGGSIVSVDSRCVYRFLDIGTAKPTRRDQERIPHFLIDRVDPDQDYSVACFLEDAPAAIAAIQAEGRRPILVGGTGYWLRTLLGGDTSAPVPPNPPLREELDALLASEGISSVAARLDDIDPAAGRAIDRRNPRRLFRAIEVVVATGRPYAEAKQSVVQNQKVHLFGLTLPPETLDRRIGERYSAMVREGWVEEVKGLLDRGYDPALPALSSLGYAEMIRHVIGELSLDNAVQLATTRCRHYARSQYRWFRPDDSAIQWFEASEDVGESIVSAIEHYSDDKHARVGRA